jgi:hypothetical protein
VFSFYKTEMPFGEDYPDPIDLRDGARLTRQVGVQVQALTQSRNDPVQQRRLVEHLRRRRTRDGRLVVLDHLPGGDGIGVLTVTGEMLLPRISWEITGVRRQLEAVGLREVEPACDCLGERLVRLRNEELSATLIDDTAAELRRQGHTASVHHVLPLANPVGKGEGGPEPFVPRNGWHLRAHQDVQTLAGTGASASPAPGPVLYPPRQRSGSGISVGVIDTGITEQIRKDGWLQGVPRTDKNVDPLDALPAGGDGYLDLGAGHGTFVAGIIEQVAPLADIHVHRALDTDGVGSELELACAMVHAVREGRQILNLSLGYRTADGLPPVALAAALDEIGRMERERGEEVLMVAAAGNDGDATPYWPAAFRRVVSVAGLTADLAPAPWATHGFWVTCSTVGQGICSTYVEGEESYDTDPDPDAFGPDSWALWSGSSFAAPQITGAVARYCQERGLAPRRALEQLLVQGYPLPGFGQAIPVLPGH